MPEQRRVGVVVGVGLLVGIMTAGSGCHTASRSSSPALDAPPMLGSRTRPAPASPIIAGNAVVHWTIAPAQGQGPAAVAGKDMVGPNGMLGLGQFGAVPVAGLTTDQARVAIEKHVAGQVPNPRVSVWVEEPARPLRRLFARQQDAPATHHWHAARPSAQVPGAAPRPAPGREVGRPSPTGADQPLRLMSGAQEPEVTPQPTPLPDHPPGPHGSDQSGEQPVPRELSMLSLPPYVIDPPDILLVQYPQALLDQPIDGQHLVRPDGTINLGIYGPVYVAGMTVEQAKLAIAAQLSMRIKKFDILNLNVDVIAYNSKFYYIVTDGAGYGQTVVRLPVTGKETVLDAISLINGLPAVASKKRIWVARRSPNDGGHHQVLPVDWCGIVQRGSTVTNYQILPGDRVYVAADKLITIDNGLTKFLNPIERLLGITLLGSTVVNSIQGTNVGTGGLGLGAIR